MNKNAKFLATVGFLTLPAAVFAQDQQAVYNDGKARCQEFNSRLAPLCRNFPDAAKQQSCLRETQQKLNRCMASVETAYARAQARDAQMSERNAALEGQQRANTQRARPTITFRRGGSDQGNSADPH